MVETGFRRELGRQRILHGLARPHEPAQTFALRKVPEPGEIVSFHEDGFAEARVDGSLIGLYFDSPTAEPWHGSMSPTVSRLEVAGWHSPFVPECFPLAVVSPLLAPLVASRRTPIEHHHRHVGRSGLATTSSFARGPRSVIGWASRLWAQALMSARRPTPAAFSRPPHAAIGHLSRSWFLPSTVSRQLMPAAPARLAVACELQVVVEPRALYGGRSRSQMNPSHQHED